MPSAAKVKKAAAKKAGPGAGKGSQAGPTPAAPTDPAAAVSAATAAGGQPQAAAAVQVDVQVRVACTVLTHICYFYIISCPAGHDKLCEAVLMLIFAAFLPPCPQLVFPASLAPRQRAAVHAVGEQYRLPHISQGEGSDRQVALGPPEARVVLVGQTAGAAEGLGGGGGAATDTGSNGSGIGGSSGGSTQQPLLLTDEQLVALIQQHLHLDATAAFAGSKPSNGSAGGAAGGRPAAARAGAAAAKPSAKGLISVEAFVAQMLPLLEMEREAEVAQASQPACLPACQPMLPSVDGVTCLLPPAASQPADSSSRSRRIYHHCWIVPYNQPLAVSCHNSSDRASCCPLGLLHPALPYLTLL